MCVCVCLSKGHRHQGCQLECFNKLVCACLLLTQPKGSISMVAGVDNISPLKCNKGIFATYV